MNVRLLLDLDGTLLERDFSRISPAPWLEQVLALGEPAAICSNQGGIAWNLAGGRPGRSYPDWPGIVARVAAGMRLARVQVAFVALHHPDANLPSGDLLWERGDAIGLPSSLIRAINSDVAVPVPIPDGVIFASWWPHWRKPWPGMLTAARKLFAPINARWLYVGDESDDKYAALNAEMEFVSVDELRPRGSKEAQ